MKNRGKRELEAYNNNNNNGDYFGETFPEFPCKKHPSSSSSSSSGGICAYCLTDRLNQLVCQECGEQKLSAYCSCSQIFTNTSSTTTDVGRISFLLENEKSSQFSTSKPKTEPKSSDNNNDFSHLRRSNSISVGAVNNGSRSETTGKFWKIGRLLFRKKRDRNNQNNNYNNSNQNINEENYECNGVSRSRSLCSFRGFYDTDQENGGFLLSSSSAARASSVSTGNFVLDSAKRSCFSESEARISNFEYCDASNFINPLNKNNNSIFSLKETEFVVSSEEDHAFIDLKLHDVLSSDNNNSSKVPDLAALKRNGLGLSTKEFGFRGGGGDHVLRHHEMLKNGGGSCRISRVSERELRKCRKSYKVWRWFFRHQENSGKFDDHTFKS
ncbi:hypothetical protein BVRB_7g177440 [Beta vulgaris subsp. vulgaris]|uniref:Uncharacterized protein n=1 Tax=Beta vulgaris subsp. vulgaris TaxID=3555 RepID=A0A0J8B897_BETVV|nr:uncharacterized protein LOC104891561 [Beta vulgaris subsp. vulgaris]KMS97226.1 hypothetical protein BVRB_7g177440 [Beta vulgaris subsp. vulgaris]